MKEDEEAVWWWSFSSAFTTMWLSCKMFASLWLLFDTIFIETFVSFRRMNMNNCCFMCILNLLRVSMHTAIAHATGGACKQSNCNMELIKMLIKWQPGKRQPCMQHATQRHQSYSGLFSIPLPSHSRFFSHVTPTLCKKCGNRTKRALSRWQKSSSRRSCEKNIDNKTNQLLKFRSPVQKDFYSYALACNAYWKRTTKKEKKGKERKEKNFYILHVYKWVDAYRFERSFNFLS